ncbi:glycosyltransferase [Candidatus Dojkabacteria bacterium]|nr:glycosyltransferase [Candidatus Dojkabacteria bacterium]
MILLLILFLVCILIFFAIHIGLSLFMGLISNKKNNEDLDNCISNQKQDNLFVSIIIPTHNEEKVVKKKLINILATLVSEQKSEIILVDDGSTDHTLDIARDFNKNLEKKIKIIASVENKGKPTALNNAVRAARGEIIVVTDADVLISEKSLSSILSNFSNPKIGAVCGREIIENPYENSITRVEYQYRNVFHFSKVIEKSAKYPPIPFHGGLMAFRRSLYTELASDTIGDDHEIAISIWKLGYDVIYDPNTVFYEHATPSLTELYQQKKRRSQGIIQVILKNRNLLFNKEFGAFGKVRFPILACEFFVSPFVFFIGIASLIFYSLFVADYTVLVLTFILALVLSATIILRSPSKQWPLDIFLLLFGLFIFQIAATHALVDVLFGTHTIHWKKIEGQRSDSK